MDEEICAKIEGNKIIIEIPIDTLVFAQEHRPDLNFKILDKNEMANYVADYIFDFDDGVTSEGETLFTKLMDGLILDAYSFGEDWLESSDFEVD
jgi:hypothetical protein